MKFEFENISLKEIVISVLEKGSTSIYLNKFINICFNISRETFLKSKFRDIVLEKTGLKVNDIAYDSIADLFKDTDGKYLYIEHHFNNNLKKISELKDDEILAKLYAITVSRTNQHITEIRKEYEENYFSVKKSIKLHINRHKDIYNLLIYDKIVYIFSCGEKELNFKKDKIDEVFIIDYLNSVNHGKNKITELLDFIYDKVNKQSNYCKAIDELILYQAVSNYFKARMSDFLSNMENVPYTNHKKDDEL